MIYFFHHYELPAILQQIRIQEMLLQNQQVGQANQTALQDNLNNNHNDTASTAGPDPQQGVPSTTQPQIDPQSSSSPTAGASGEVRAELNWVAQTAAIITEALSSSVQQPPAQEADSVRGAAGGQVEELSVVAEFWMAGGGSEAETTSGEDSNLLSVEIKTAAEGSDPQLRGLQMEASDAGAPQTHWPPSQSPDTDWDSRPQQQSSSRTSSSETTCRPADSMPDSVPRSHQSH